MNLSVCIWSSVGLGVQENKIMSHKMQEDHFTKHFIIVYDKLSIDATVGSTVKNIPMKFLNIGTSKAKEIMSGVVLRKRYSAMKSYINNTLSPLWRQ